MTDLTPDQESALLRSFTRNDDSCTHNVAPLFELVNQLLEMAEMNGYEKGLLAPTSEWMASRADAWDEGHRFTGFEPEPGENPYREMGKS